jgi:hypothetical protein
MRRIGEMPPNLLRQITHSAVQARLFASLDVDLNPLINKGRRRERDQQNDIGNTHAPEMFAQLHFARLFIDNYLSAVCHVRLMRFRIRISPEYKSKFRS